MNKQDRGGDAEQDRKKPDEPTEPPEDERAPRYLQLLALPIIIMLILAVIGLVFYWKYSTGRPPASGTEEISEQAARPVASPARLAQGPLVPAFEAHAIAGQRLNFPSDYKGKLVMLDFWATWCGPCVREIPNVVETYRAFHPHGLEIVGVTLDRTPPDSVMRFTQSSSASWPQVYENAWDIARQFRVSAIPAAFLVDGDTGRLLASGEDLRGASLRATIGKWLEQKKGSHNDGE